MTAGPRFSVVIPAYNEAQLLPRLLDTVDAAKDRYLGGPGQVEVVVADNASTDGTGRIALERGCRVAYVWRRRIACSRNGGAAIARGEVLCFVDADYRIHPETFNVIDRELATGRFVGGATGLTLERRTAGVLTVVCLILPTLWAMGLDGGVWFCPREHFDAVGGYDESVPISEDVRFLWALRRWGRRRRPRLKLSRGRATGPPAPAVVSLRKFDRHGDWHFLLDLVRMPLYLALSRKRLDDHIRRYWYER